MSEDAAAAKFENLEGLWMKCPKVELEYPALAYFVPLDKLIVAAKTDSHHEPFGRTQGCFTIFNRLGEKVFLAIQEANKCNVKIFNVHGNPVLEMIQPLTFFVHKAAVFCPPGKNVGVVEEKFSFRTNKFLVTAAEDDWTVEIKTKRKSLVYNVVFNEDTIGVIRNSWFELALCNVENFGVTFPVDLDVGKKAVLLGACFLIAYLKYA